MMEWRAERWLDDSPRYLRTETRGTGGARVLRVLIDPIALEERGLARPKALAEMQTLAGIYDLCVLESVSVRVDVAFSGRSEPAGAVLEISLKDLRVRHRLLDKIETLDGVMIVGGGTLETPMLPDLRRD